MSVNGAPCKGAAASVIAVNFYGGANMKKAKRLLAVIMAAIMLMTAAYLPSYAYIDANVYNPPSTGNIKNYYYTYDQAAGYLLDMLDHLLLDANIVLTIDGVEKFIGGVVDSLGLLEGNLWPAVNLDQYLSDAGVNPATVRTYGLTPPSGLADDKGYLDLRNIDLAIRSLYAVADVLANNSTVQLLEGLSLLGDLVNETKGLATLWSYSSYDYLRKNQNDTLVLEYVVSLVVKGLGPMLRGILGGTFSVGSLLEDTINDLLKDFLGPRASLKTLNLGIKDLLYSLLINTDAEVMNGGTDADGNQIYELDDPSTPEVEKVETVDDIVQQLIDWALIEGTGEYIYNGGNSILGKKAEGFLPALGEEELKKAGGANIGSITIQADRDLDGALETHTMSFYQLVSNVLQALLGGMLTPMLSELIVDLVGIEITEQYPNGDPSISTDMMYGLLLGSVSRDETGALTSTAGAIENLLVANGAPKLVISNYDSAELPADSPVGHVTAVIKWFLDDGGLDALIKIDYLGIHIQDNFMSLLDDLIRLAINLLPALGLEIESDLLYTPDQLNEYWAYDADMNIIPGGSDGEVDSLYLTREAGEIIYVDSYIENPDGSKTPSIYCYLENGNVVNTTDKDAANYRNPGFIRQHYQIPTSQVYACVIKVLLDMFIPGCYFPDWATDIPTVLAYGLASLASPLLPQNNYFARLDAYHTQETREGDQFVNGVNVTPIPYTKQKTIVAKDMYGNVVNKEISVPQAALDIGCSYLAAYLNNVLDINDQEKLDTDTSLEKFAGEFLVWGFTNYLPMFTGLYENGAFVAYHYNGVAASEVQEANMTLEKGVFTDAVNNYISSTYSNWATRTPLYEDDNHEAYDAIYDLIDNTLFKLIPTSWLPNINGSEQFVLDWLLGNICEFDLQGILDLLSVNTAADAELNKPVIEVLLRVIDRVLALVVNDHAILLDTNRRPITTSPYPETSVKTLEGLLDCNGEGAALPTLVFTLLQKINEFKRPLLSTLLPLIFGSIYERPYDEQYLGRKGIAYYSVADLEDYTDSLTQHINARLVKTFENEEDAEAACSGGAKTVRNDNGTYSIVLSNGSEFNVYPDSASATSALHYLDDAYYVAVETDNVNAETGEPIYNYEVYHRESYMTASLYNSTATDTSVDYGQQKYEYTDFAYASLTPRGPSSDFVSYGFEYQTFQPEDFRGKEYYYTNVNNTIEGAQEFASSYRSFATSTLPDAYGDWYMYSVETQLRSNDIWDSNGDGYSVMGTDSDGNGLPDDTDCQYTTNDDGSYNITVGDDGEPGMPEAMYPFYTTNATQFTFYDDMTSTDITTEYMNYFNTDSYDQLALAVEYGANPENNVVLSEHDTESVIRLALFQSTDLGKNALQFDITYNGDNQYNGSYQWTNLPNNYLTAVADWLDNNGFTYEAVLDENGNATGNYIIARPAFKLIDSSFSISTPAIGLGSTPAHPGDATLTQINNMSILDTKSDYQKNYKALHKAYVEYITALYQNRRSLYNTMDDVSYRIEQAELQRSVPMENNGDLIVLDWALDYARQFYMFDGGRNYKSTGNTVDGKPEYTKVYTSTSFEVFQRAYDYAQSLRNEVVRSAAANLFTQSMVTAAYQGILAAIRQLVEFTGFADWTMLDYYMAMAEDILNDPNKDDPVLGYESGLDVLEDVYETAEALRADPTVDCERQEEIAEQAALLNTAIQTLVFRTIPSIRPSDSSDSIDTIAVSNVNNRLIGHIFGLEEGTGISADMYDDNGSLVIAGMTIDTEIGSEVGINPSGFGNGTGAYISGRIRTIERFRYYAVIYGDLNGDTRIDGSDASYVDYQIANGENTEADMGSVLFVAADTNHDNIVDATDAKYIRNHYTYAEGVDANGDGVVNDKDKITQDEHRTETVS